MSEATSKDATKIGAIVTIAVAVVGLIGTIVTVIYNFKTATSVPWIPMYGTQTAEASAALATHRAAGDTPVATLITEIPTNASSTTTPQPTVSPTLAIISPTPLIPSPCCLTGWDIFSSDGKTFPPAPSGACSNAGIDELGIHASNCNLIFAIDDLKQRGVYGLSMPILQDSVIKMSVSITLLIEGEFWLGFSSSVDPQAGSLIYAMTPDPGGVSVFLNNISAPLARYPWAPMGDQISWVKGQPRRYDFDIRLDGNKVAVTVNSVTFVTEVASSTDRLFLGYRSKPEKQPPQGTARTIASARSHP